jgi:hypothetical protein
MAPATFSKPHAEAVEDAFHRKCDNVDRQRRWEKHYKNSRKGSSKNDQPATPDATGPDAIPAQIIDVASSELVLPRRDKRGNERGAVRKTLQLCEQVRGAVSGAIDSEDRGAVCTGFEVSTVAAGKGGHRLTVYVGPISAQDGERSAEVQNFLDMKRDQIRLHVGRAIAREKVSHLDFVVLPFVEQEPPPKISLP